MSPIPTELEVPKPEVDVPLVSENGEAVDAEDAADAGGVGDGVLPLLGGRLLAELAEGVEVGLVVDVGDEVLLEGAGALETVLELTPLLHDLRDLSTIEEASALQLLQLVCHPLESVPYHVRHFLLLLLSLCCCFFFFWLRWRETERERERGG